jgi:hypothetical protein
MATDVCECDRETTVHLKNTFDNIINDAMLYRGLLMLSVWSNILLILLLILF